MAYEIVSARIGTPGAPYEVRPGINVDALLAAGFIKVSTPKPAKNAKTKTDTNEKE
jgi:hypothetical protein